jgi:hypothetical protein
MLHTKEESEALSLQALAQELPSLRSMLPKVSLMHLSYLDQYPD